MQFLDSKRVRSHFSAPNELWQNGAAKSAINGYQLYRDDSQDLDGCIRSWGSVLAQDCHKDTRDVTFEARIGITPYSPMYGQKKDVPGFLAFVFRA